MKKDESVKKQKSNSIVQIISNTIFFRRTIKLRSKKGHKSYKCLFYKCI